MTGTVLVQFMNLKGLEYERLLQLQQKRTKATMWKLYEFQIFRGAKEF